MVRIYFQVAITLLKEKVRRFIHPAIYKSNQLVFEDRKRFYALFLNKGDLVFDVGANLGNRIEVFLGLNTRVVAFEPQMYCYLFLRWKYSSSMTLLNMALGSAVDKMTMYINPKSSTISSLSADWINVVKLNRFKDEQWNKTQEVQVSTLDLMIKSHGKPKFIKIDVEGFEVEVLKGLSSPVDYICFEYTIPEQTQHVFTCLAQLHQLSSHYEYNFSLEETNRFVFDTWLSYDEMLFKMENQVAIFQGFGDIYAKLRA